MQESKLTRRELKGFLLRISHNALRCGHLANKLEQDAKYLSPYPIDITEMLEHYDFLKNNVEALKIALNAIPKIEE